ncbi:type II toxin-antitoxin system RelE/ParE family toxin [Rhizobium sp. P44RR-XXIV]|uniref:type II toxin-antitoxin system RelE/ParE family toxin n=1 Tax=Rhizobium sp. P44RR-XXIV TaxID=1921145 RepID=UPI000984AFC9|nr:type II toxin-antitoxin system RelE/ParE family toxin [Rhizobium sp. P44RR-XXIV]TIX91617.1 type II toxin-antitoxin system RelE/ParE family toxin [Rhizobium sp. P44RR-XXIV]
MKPYKIILHERAEAELRQLYRDLAGDDKAGLVVAWNYVSGIRQFLMELATFPKRGTVRDGLVPGLRIIGYRRSVSIAFVVEEAHVMILGVFYGGQDITVEALEERL